MQFLSQKQSTFFTLLIRFRLEGRHRKPLELPDAWLLKRDLVIFGTTRAPSVA